MRIFLYQIITITLVLFLTSCDLFSNNEDIVYELSYSGSGVETVTSNKDGRVSITSALDIEETRYEVSFDFTMLNEDDGKPISGIELHYTHLHDKILIYIVDPDGNFSPSLFWGTPNELADYFGTTSVQKSKFDQNRIVISGTVALGIVAGIFLVGVARSYIGISRGIVKMSNHYSSGFVRQEEDYTLYCKTFTELFFLMLSHILFFRYTFNNRY